jgi:transcriptional regulator with XRE-family HTH domain
VPKPKFTNADYIFRELLKEIRLKKNLTQAELAERLKQPQSYVSKVETGERRLDFVETAIVCKALDLDLRQFADVFSRRLNQDEVADAGAVRK